MPCTSCPLLFRLPFTRPAIAPQKYFSRLVLGRVWSLLSDALGCSYLPDDAPGFLGKFNIYTMVEQLSQSPFPYPLSSSPPPPNFHDNLLIHLHHLCFSASAASETNSSNSPPPSPTSILPTLPILQVLFPPLILKLKH